MKKIVKTKSNLEHATHVTLVGVLWNILLIVLKLFAGIAGKSSALIADAIHSMSDFVSDIAVLAGIRIASRPRDITHNYGHGRFETLSTVFIAICLIAAGAGIMWQGAVSIHKIWNMTVYSAPAFMTLIVAAISIIVKEGMFHYTVRAGKKLNSQPLIANAWHHRTDAFSSIMVLIGIASAYFLGGKWVLLDPLAALIVGVYILNFAFRTLVSNLNELLDASLGEDENEKIKIKVSQLHGVEIPHNIKTRKVGNTIAVEMHIKVAPHLSIVEAHNIATDVEQQLKEMYGNDSFISVHVEPYIKDDE